MATAPDDYSAYQERPTDEKFAHLAALANRQVTAEKAVEDAEAALAKAQDSLRTIVETEVPEFMEQVMGLEEVKLRDGRKVTIKEAIRAGITKERAPKAFKWLRDNGHDALIKNVMKLEFGKGEDARADAARILLSVNEFEVDVNETVNAQTLGAFVREKLTDGTLPDEAQTLLGVHRQKFSKIT